jgi:hypothetical protein
MRVRHPSIPGRNDDSNGHFALQQQQKYGSFASNVRLFGLKGGPFSRFQMKITERVEASNDLYRAGYERYERRKPSSRGGRGVGSAFPLASFNPRFDVIVDFTERTANLLQSPAKESPAGLRRQPSSRDYSDM